MVCYKLTELETFVHSMLDLAAHLSSDVASDLHVLLRELHSLVKKSIQLVWPCLTVIGGIDIGFCCGQKCFMKGDGTEVVIVSIPESFGMVEVEVQDDVRNCTKQAKTRYVFNSYIAVCHADCFMLFTELFHYQIYSYNPQRNFQCHLSQMR